MFSIAVAVLLTGLFVFLPLEPSFAGPGKGGGGGNGGGNSHSEGRASNSRARDGNNAKSGQPARRQRDISGMGSMALAVELGKARKARAALPKPKMTPAAIEALILVKRNDPATSNKTLLALVRKLNQAEAYVAAQKRVKKIEKAYRRRRKQENRVQNVASNGGAGPNLFKGFLSIFK